MKWENIGEFSLTTLVILCAGWLVKMWLEHKIKADVESKYKKEHEAFSQKLISENAIKLEQFKSQLSSETTKEVEQLKSQLAIAASERQLRFSHVFVDTAKTITNTYHLLFILRQAVGHYVVLEKDCDVNKRNEKLGMVQHWSREFTNDYPKNKLYIPKQTRITIEAFLNTLSNLMAQYERKVAFEQASLSPTHIYKIECGMEGLEQQITTSLNSLEDEFQIILGFPIENPSNESSIDVRNTLYGQQSETKEKK